MPATGATGPLTGIAVLDISRSAAGAWCSRLLADMGADVVMLEPEGGHPLRRLGVLPNGRSPIAEYLLANKRSVSCDVTSREESEELRAAVGGVDVLVSSFSAIESDALGLRTHCKAQAGLVVAHITPHGL